MIRNDAAFLEAMITCHLAHGCHARMPQAENGSKSPRHHLRRKGFSLVEVALALGICSFCLVAILGLLPTGISANQNTLQQTAAAAVARAVAADFWSVSATAMNTAVANNTVPPSTPTFQIPTSLATAASTLPTTRFFAEDGSVAQASITTAVPLASARYRVDVAYGTRNTDTQPVPVRILVTWPALANPNGGQWPTNVSNQFQIVTVMNPF